ncbi:MAG: PPC domain-containing DNA-binding protein [Sphingobium sp.]
MTSFAETPKIKAEDLDYRRDGMGYLLVLRKGQPVVASLNAFLAKENIPGASISGIGAVENAEVAYYDIAAKQYRVTTFAPSMEVLSLKGNLGSLDGEPVVHAHIALGGADYTVHGGHLREATVSLILEIFITPTTKPIERERNNEFPELRTMKRVRATD